jgi:hypothetical protein
MLGSDANSGLTIGYVCATKGRPLIKHLIGSFKSFSSEGDRLHIIGDGWHEDWIDSLLGQGVTFEKGRKVGVFGHQHFREGLENDRCGTDLVGIIGDDDVFSPGAFDYYRRLARDAPAEFVIVDLVYYRLLMHKKNRMGDWSDFGPQGLNDAFFFMRELMKGKKIRIAEYTTEVNKIYCLTKEQWDRVNVWGEWDPGYARAYYSTQKVPGYSE